MSIACTYRGVGYGFELPPGYRECEYLESTGTQYIITDLPVKYSRVICKAKSRSKINDNHMFGCRYVHSGYVYHLTYWSSSWSWGNGTGNFIDYTAPEVDCLSTHVFDLCASNDTEFTIDGEVKATTTLDFSLCPEDVKVYLFSRYHETYKVQLGKWVIYWFKILDIRDNTWHTILPVLDPLGVPCMYDTISRKTFYNAGTGTFNYKLKPLQFPNGYTELEYLESTGTQWIETEVPAQINVKLQGKIQFPDGYYESYFASLRVDGGNTRYYLLNMDATGSRYVGLVCTKYVWAYAASMNTSDGVSSPVEFESYIGDTSCYIKVDSAMYENNNVPTGVPTNKTIPLFGGKTNNSDVVNNFSPRTRLWYARLSVNDELVRYFLPYLDPEGEPCMVDILTGTPYYNQGTGTFNYKLK